MCPLFEEMRKAVYGGRGYLKPKVWGAEAVSGWEEEEEEEEEEERSEMRSKGEPGSQQPTMEGRSPRQVIFSPNFV